MAAYAEMMSALRDQPGFVAVTLLHVFLAMLFFAFVGTWLPLLLLGKRRSTAAAEAGSDSHENGPSILELLIVAVGGGLVLATVAGTASAFAAKQLMPGIIASLACGACTTIVLIKRLRGETRPQAIGWKLFIAITCIAAALGLWQHVITAMPFERADQRAVAFSSLHYDNGFHCFLASVLSETGLPLRDLHGSPTHEFGAVTHTGHGVLMGMLAAVLQTNVYRASTALWIVGLVLLAWALAALLARSPIPKAFVFLGSLGALVLGPITMPPFVVLSDPRMAMTLNPIVAGRMYWNLPQALSTALAAVGLVCFDRYCRCDARSTQLRMLFCTATLLAVSGWVKPSLVVFYGPALFIVLLLQRARLSEFAVTLAVFAAGAAIYLLPAWLVPVAKHPAWSIHPSVTQTQHVLAFVALGGGAVLLLSVIPLRDFFKGLLRRMEPQSLTLALIAAGGSILFALLFREDRFASQPDLAVYQPNLWWGPAACIVLLFPLALRSALERMLAANKADWFVIAGLMLALLQAGSGVFFAVAYPAIIGRIYPQQHLDVLTAARNATPPQTRFLVDPKLNHSIYGFSDLAGWLSRPCLFGTSYMAPEEQEIFKSWSALFEQPARKVDTSWSQYDAAIVATGSQAARGLLKQQGWTSEELSEGYELWRPAATLDTPQP